MLEQQFAIDIQAALTGGHQFIVAEPNPHMRSFARNHGTFIIYRGHLLCRLDDPELVRELQFIYAHYDAQWFGELENLKELESLLGKYSYTASNYSPFFIPASTFEPLLDPAIYLFGPEEIVRFQNNPEFKEAFLFDPADPDLLGASISLDKQIVGVAGLNANGAHAVEIGVHISESYRYQGLASRLVRAITTEARKRFPDKLITYGTQFTHHQSINVAIRSGFKHAWTELSIEKV